MYINCFWFWERRPPTDAWPLNLLGDFSFQHSSAIAPKWHYLPAEEHHCPLAATKLYCLPTEAHMCMQLLESQELHPPPVNHKSDAQPMRPPWYLKRTYTDTKNFCFGTKNVNTVFWHITTVLTAKCSFSGMIHTSSTASPVVEMTWLSHHSWS